MYSQNNTRGRSTDDIRRTYASVSDAAAHAFGDAPMTRPSNTMSLDDERRSLAGTRKRDWCGWERSAEATIARWTYWPEGAAKMLGMIGHIAAPQVASVRRRRVWGDEGDALDRDRLYAGDTDVMWARMHRAPHGARPIRIAVNCAVQAATSVDALMWRGGAALVLADALATAGHAVETIAVSAWSQATMDARGITIETVVQPMGSPVIAGAIAGASHPSFIRILTFALEARAADSADTDVRLSMGYPGPYVPATTGDGALVVVVPNGILSATTAQAWLRETVAAIEAGQAVPA